MENEKNRARISDIGSQRGFSRRDFVKLTGGIASLALPAFGQEAPHELGLPRQP
jgi:hypothetical protein